MTKTSYQTTEQVSISDQTEYINQKILEMWVLKIIERTR